MMMKTLILASLLLFAVPVGDEITESDIVDDRVYLEGRPCYASTDARGKLFAHCFMPGLKGDVVIDVLPDPCLTKMESAMKAMEPFIMADWQYHLPDGDARKNKVKQLQRAEELWYAGKQCWRHDENANLR